MQSLKQAKEKCQLGMSHRQSAIKLIEKKMDIKGKLKFGYQYHYLTLIQKLYQRLSLQSQKNSSNNNFFKSNCLC